MKIHYNKLIYKPTLKRTTSDGITLTILALANTYLNNPDYLNYHKFKVVGNMGDTNEVCWNFNTNQEALNKFNKFINMANFATEYVYQQHDNFWGD